MKCGGVVEGSVVNKYIVSDMSSVSSLKVLIRSEAVRHMTDSAVSLSILAVRECAARYGFSAEEALESLNLSSVSAVEVAEKKSRKVRVAGRGDVDKPKAVKASFPLPYNGEMNETCCFGLRLCEGLYTQCRVARKGDASFCKVCEEVADKNNGVPAYGTIQERKACYDSNVEFKDPKGKSPVAYSRVMRKHKLTEAQVVEEAGKLNIVINPIHFTVVDGETKRGRPKTTKAAAEPKGPKGRPKKSKKVLEIDGGEDDLFATLMAEANAESSGSDEVSTIASEAEASTEIAIKTKEPKKKATKEAEKATKAAEKEAEKAKKEAEKEAEKLKKEQEKKLKEAEKATKAAEKATKAAGKETEKAAKEVAKALKEAEKAAKEAAKALKEAEKKQKEEAKPATPAASIANDEPDVVKRFEFEGKKYLKSKKTGIIYNMDQDVIGKWNETTNKIDFTSTDEEVEEAYEEEEEEEEEEVDEE